MSEIKLEVGKTYRNRKGEEVKIVEKIGGNLYQFIGNLYQFKGSNNKWYTESGRCDAFGREHPCDLIEEATATRHTFDIPDGVKKVTVEQVGNRIVVEMVPEDVETPKAGDVMISDWGGVYILKEVKSDDTHIYFVMLRKNGHLFYWSSCFSGRPATPEEAQPLWDALKKAGKKWNPETMQVEDVPESDRIREWVETNIKEGYYNHEDVAEAIEGYLKQKEGEK